jgi:hypothetical protein
VRERRNAYTVLVGASEVKRPVEGTCHRLMDSIKINPREIGWVGMD